MMPHLFSLIETNTADIPASVFCRDSGSNNTDAPEASFPMMDAEGLVMLVAIRLAYGQHDLACPLPCLHAWNITVRLMLDLHGFAGSS